MSLSYKEKLELTAQRNLLKKLVARVGRKGESVARLGKLLDEAGVEYDQMVCDMEATKARVADLESKE